MKILTIDDEKDELVAITTMLGTFLPDCETAIANSGSEGVELARTFQPDTILLDIQMPKMDGFEVCRILKSDAATRHIPVIFLTAQKADHAKRIQGLEIGGDAFLAKPVDSGELMAKVRAMVRIKLAEDALRNETHNLEQVVADRTAALQTEMTNLDTIFNSSPMAMLVLDEKTNIVRLNAATIALAGGSVDPRDFRPGNVLRCFYCLQDPRGCGYGPNCPACPLRSAVQSVAAGGAPLHGFEQALEVVRDGRRQTVWLRMGVEPLLIAGRRHVIVALDDITARKQTEEELESVNRILYVLRECHHALVHAEDESKLMQQTCDAIVKLGVFRMAWVGLAESDAFKTVRIVAKAGLDDGYLQSVKISWQDIDTGRGPTGTAIRTGRIVVNPDFATNPMLAPWRDAALKNGFASSVALPLSAEGRMLGALTIYSAKLNAFGEQEVKLLEDMARDLAYGLCALRNRKALRESEEQFRTMFEMASIGKAQADPHTGRWLRVNQKFCDITGYSATELLQMRIPDITFPEDRQKDWEAFQQVVKGEMPSYQIEKRYVRKDGKQAWVNINMAVIRGADGQPLRTTATIEDITSRKQAEEERAKMESQLRQAQKMDAVGRLAGGVAHDFNNMLGIIIGNAELAMMNLKPSDPVYKGLGEIQAAGQRSAALTRQLLAFARKQTIAPKVLNFNETIESMLNMLRRLIGENIHLLWKPGVGLWPVKMDSAQIDQILANLAVNARDAIATSGQLIVETQNVKIDETFCQTHAGFSPGSYVMLAVSDDGCGMDKETQDRLFEPFFTTKSLGKGTGMGLAIVYGIVNQNDGLISVYSEPDKGTTFKIYLPRHVSTEAETEETQERAELLMGTETVLLVEDEPSLLGLAKMMLETLGYTVLAADGPTHALQLAQQHVGPIHLLMTDVVMPEMSGNDLRQKFNATRPGLKCLFMSGYTADIISHHGILAERVHFLEKPFSLHALGEKLREVLEDKG